MIIVVDLNNLNLKHQKFPNAPDYYKSEFNNGIKIIGTEYSELPKVFLQIKIDGGNYLEDKKKLGLSAITAELMNKSTVNFSSEEMEKSLSKIGSEISFSSSGNSTTIFVSSFTKKIDETLKLLEEKLFNPSFNNDELKTTKKQQIEFLNSQEKSAQYINDQTNLRKYYLVILQMDIHHRRKLLTK